MQYSITRDHCKQHKQSDVQVDTTAPGIISDAFMYGLKKRRIVYDINDAAAAKKHCKRSVRYDVNDCNCYGRLYLLSNISRARKMHLMK
jgi:hypothetical protein